MGLKPEEAADICKHHGLTLNDAAGLLGLADTAEEADRIAARFADGPSTDTVGAEYVRQLFGTDDHAEADETADPPTGRASTEGANPAATDKGEIEMRQFAQDLFNQSN